jgi:hypothetical protein
MERQNVAVYGDLTALYAARSIYRKLINYETLDTVLKAAVNLQPEDSFDVSNFYTLFSNQNEKQVSFVNTLKDLGWGVTTAHPREVKRGKPVDHRFDTDIGYDIGFGIEEFNKILIVSDSFELARTLNRFQDDDSQCQINLAFFSEALDPRWWPIIRDTNSPINFIDLDVELYNDRG